jgi:opacity protein-like surface antigen
MCAALAGTMGVNVAQAVDLSGVYLGLDVGRAEAKQYCDNITNCDNADTSIRGEVGYMFSDMLAAEIGYTSFGTLFSANGSGFNAKQDAGALTISGLATWKVSDVFGIFGRLGAARYFVDNVGTVLSVPVKDKNAVKPYFGVGVNFDLSSNWMLRAEYQDFKDISRVDGEKDDIQAWYMGGVYRF